MELRWHLDGWADYVDWQTNDKKILRKINVLLEDALRHPTEGPGKPEPLKRDFSGFWSRRITQEHRLVYAFDEESLTVFQCKGHDRQRSPSSAAATFLLHSKMKMSVPAV